MSNRDPGSLATRHVRSSNPFLTLGLAAILAVVLAAGIVILLVVRNSGNSSSRSNTTATTKKSLELISRQELAKLGKAIGSPIYWAGPRSGVRYELTQTSDGRYFVRYLPVGVPAGSAKRYPFVATFPIANAYAATSRAASRSTSVRVGVPGGVGFYGRSSPTNVYMAMRGSDRQVEVYDPDPARARQLVEQGRVERVEAATTTTAPAPQSASIAELKRLSGSVGHSVYWAGAKQGTTYELTRTTSSRIFIRYLPAGAALGTNKPYLFVASFPVGKAYAITKAAASRAGSIRIPVPGGGIAFHPKTSPNNFYIAFPGSDVQIEVFDPQPAQAQTLIRSGRIKPVP
jgi:hypothetical protein